MGGPVKPWSIHVWRQIYIHTHRAFFWVILLGSCAKKFPLEPELDTKLFSYGSNTHDYRVS